MKVLPNIPSWVKHLRYHIIEFTKLESATNELWKSISTLSRVINYWELISTSVIVKISRLYSLFVENERCIWVNSYFLNDVLKK